MMKSESEIRELYNKLKEAEGKWALIDSETKIKISKGNLALRILEWILEDKPMFTISNLFGGG